MNYFAYSINRTNYQKLNKIIHGNSRCYVAYPCKAQDLPFSFHPMYMGKSWEGKLVDFIKTQKSIQVFIHELFDSFP